jgi:hypothetical protein
MDAFEAGEMTEEVLNTERRENIIIRLWKGNVSLGKTYWLYGVLAGLIIRLISPLVTYGVSYNLSYLSTFDVSLIIYSWIAAVLLYSAFMSVSIWQSATKYKQSYPETKANGTLAQAAVILGILVAAASFIPKDDNSKNLIGKNSMVSSDADERLQHEAMLSGLNARYNEGLPKMIDAVTRLNKMEFSDKGWSYFETITVHVDNPSEFLKRVKPSIVEGLCKESNTLDGLKSGLSFRYFYADADGNKLGNVEIIRSDCPT